MLERPTTAAVLRRFALPPAASCLGASAILWPGAVWMWKTAALLVAGALVVLTELPSSAIGGATLRGRAASVAVLVIILATVAVATVGLVLGGPARVLVPAALVSLALHVVGHLGEGGVIARHATTEAAIALSAVLVAVGAEQTRGLGEAVFRGSAASVEPRIPEPVAGRIDGGATEPYSTPDPNLPAPFGGDGGSGARPAGSCPEELTEENAALVWMRLWERRDEGTGLKGEEGEKPAAVVPRRLHCACAAHRDRPELSLAYCGRTRELCQAEAGTRAGAGSCGVVAVSIVRRVDCRLDLRGISVRADETSLGVSIRTIGAASKLVPQWATLDARELSRGRLMPIRVQRLRWSRGSTAPADWRATNFPGASRAASALGRSLARTGLRCRGSSCEGGDGRAAIDWCAGTNEVSAAQEPSGAARSKKTPAKVPPADRPRH